MKAILVFIAMSLVTSVQARVFLSHCSEFQNSGVSYSYQSCVNRNFNSVSREMNNTYLSNCSNFGNDVSHSFTSCIDRNFNTIQREYPSLYLSYCMNFNREKLDYSYVSCVNRNFSTVERFLNSREQ